MGGLEQLSEGKAILYYIHSEGYGERVDFRCTGHGGGYAYSLAKFLCGPHLCQSLSAEDIAKRVAFVISWVAEDVDSTVGGDPDVFIIRDRDPEAEQLPEDKIQKEIEHARKAKEDFSSLLFPQE